MTRLSDSERITGYISQLPTGTVFSDEDIAISIFSKCRKLLPTSVEISTHISRHPSTRKIGAHQWMKINLEKAESENSFAG